MGTTSGKRILVTGSLGQIGSELTHALRRRYGAENVVASDVREDAGGALSGDGPFVTLDVLDGAAFEAIVADRGIDTIYHLAAILSAVAEEDPQRAWRINVDGLCNALEASSRHGCSLFTPSSIGAFGPTTPLDDTPQDTIMRPSSMYGVTKVSGELLCDYYHERFGVDTRGVRYPGIISNVTMPGGGTTDYAVEIYYAAVMNGSFTCPLRGDTSLDMMYMPDAIKAAIDVMEANEAKLRHRNAFNVTAMHFTPEEIAAEIRRHMPGFEIDYDIDPVRQKIADSWPNRMDDSAAKEEWNWAPEYDLAGMTADMLSTLSERRKKGLIEYGAK